VSPPSDRDRSARDRLLAAVLDHVRGAGIGEASLRSLAAAVGTSHRMLLYHFGSRDGLVAAVVEAVEAEQRVVLHQLADAWAGDPVGAMRAFWATLADPALHESERLFFEAVALALRQRAGTEGLRESLVEPWLDAAVAATATLGGAGSDDERAARLDARVGMALTRGLLLDLLITGDRAGVDAAMERFVTRYR
jgi:AcrR family transcriptional regulator